MLPGQQVAQTVARAMAEERRQALLVCLAAKFGALPVAVHQRVRSADAATCDARLDRMTLAGSLAEGVGGGVVAGSRTSGMVGYGP